METKIELVKIKLAGASRIVETSPEGFDRGYPELEKAHANLRRCYE